MSKTETKNLIPKTFFIDATGKSMGRLATQVVNILLGKNRFSYQRNRPATNHRIEIANISKVWFSGRKLSQKVYFRHTGYIGHLRETKMKDLFEKDPGGLFIRVVRGMLPKNKWRDKLLKQIIFK